MPDRAAATAVLVPIAAYLLGSIPVAWILGRLGGVDLRRLGSGNPGTSNLFRNSGVRLALLSGPLQFAQGGAAVLLARLSGGGPTIVELAALCAVVGNGWPIWFGFNGQRGIAVATGAVAALNPALLAVLLACFAAGALTHAIAVGVLAGFCLLPLAALWLGDASLAITGAVMLGAVVLRRLEGFTADLREARSDTERRVLLRRLFLDERPGQVLVGARDDQLPVEEG